MRKRKSAVHVRKKITSDESKTPIRNERWKCPNASMFAVTPRIAARIDSRASAVSPMNGSTYPRACSARSGTRSHDTQATMLRNAARSGVEVNVDASIPIETKSADTRTVPIHVPRTDGQSGRPPTASIIPA